MARFTLSSAFLLAVLAATSSYTNAFAPNHMMQSKKQILHRTSSLNVGSTYSDVPFYAERAHEEEEVSAKQEETPSPMVVASEATTTTNTEKPKKAASNKLAKGKAGGGGKHKEGVFSPLVYLAKDIMGDAELNKLRGKIIGLHSDVIGKFVETHQTPFGQRVLKAMFDMADKDANGTIEQDELEQALHSLGFDFLKEKQIKGVFERADADSNGRLDLDEFLKEAPKTLRTNLIKLAKKNGGDMGLLA